VIQLQKSKRDLDLLRESSSYRDPDGYIVHANDDIYRCVVNPGSPILLNEYKPFFDKAVEKGLLVGFHSSDSEPAEIENSEKYLKLQKLPFISYPYEWGFEQLKSSALLTLDLCLLALEYGLTLKDATAFNTQLFKGKMVFIDHTSFEKTDGKLPWAPYSQFCRHYLAPLLVCSKTGQFSNKLFRIELDGLDLKYACDVLPFSQRFNPSVFIHIYLHHRMINKYKENKDSDQIKKIKARRTGDQKAYLTHLRQVILKIKPPEYSTAWCDYYDHTNYQDASFKMKEALIHQILSGKNRKYKSIWDVGANNGHFSRLAAPYAENVISMDIDYAAIDHNVRANLAGNIENIFPVVMDVTNPSPSLGFGLAERKPLHERSQPELILALALIHHLAVTHNIPFSLMAEQFSSYNSDMIVEYVGRDDSQFQRLLNGKEHSYEEYNLQNFEDCFSSFFDIAEKFSIEGTSRILYHLKPVART
jgi:hypothetical protein